MPHRLPLRVIVILVLAAWVGGSSLFAAQKEAMVGVDDKWRHYRSPNFELYSRNSESESRELLRNLELLRAVSQERFKFTERAKLEVTVFYFRTLEDFRAYGADFYGKANSFKGYYLARPDRAVIAMSPTETTDGAQRMIFHEYVHHLFRTAEDDPPVWYNEGMAELLAGLRIDGDSIEIGHPHAGRLRALRAEKLMPLETLFGVTHQSPVYRSSDHTGLFYAQSWALLHYWYCGETNFPPDAVKKFLGVAADRKLAAATDLRAVFKECFGFDYAEMERRLDRYVISGSYRYSRQAAPKIDKLATYEMRPVSRDEIRVRLAELALRASRAPFAKLQLLEAIEKNPTDPRPFEVLGVEALIDRDENGARARWEQAVTAGTRNVAIYRELGLIESRAWFHQFDYYFRLPPETTERLRTRLQRSIEYAPQQSAAYEMLAWVEAFAEEPSIANINAVQNQFNGLQRKQRTLLALAFVRVRVDKPDEARALLDQLDQMNPDAWTARGAEIVRAKLEGRRPRRPEGATTTTPGKPRQFVPAAPLKVPSMDVPSGK
jgi:hypothetical protein